MKGKYAAHAKTGTRLLYHCHQIVKRERERERERKVNNNTTTHLYVLLELNNIW
jgi:hypothetical protein